MIPQYHDNLRLGRGIEPKKLDKLKSKIANKPFTARVYLIAIAQNKQDQLEIYYAEQLMWRYYKKNPPYIIGITITYQEALEILEQIVQECWKERGDCALREYLLCRKV